MRSGERSRDRAHILIINRRISIKLDTRRIKMNGGIVISRMRLNVGMAIVGGSPRRIAGRMRIRKMWGDILLHAMRIEIEAISNTEKSKKERKRCNRRDMWAHHLKVHRDRPNITERVADTTTVNLVTLKGMRIKVSMWRTELRRSRTNSRGLSFRVGRSKMSRSRKLKLTPNRHRVVSIRRECRKTMRRDFRPNLNLAWWDRLSISHRLLPTTTENSTKITQEKSSTSLEETSPNEKKNKQRQSNRKESNKKSKELSQNVRSSSKNRSLSLNIQSWHLSEGSLR